MASPSIRNPSVQNTAIRWKQGDTLPPVDAIGNAAPLLVDATTGKLLVDAQANISTDLSVIEGQLGTIASDLAIGIIAGVPSVTVSSITATNQPLPTGAATSANQISGGPQLGSGVVTATTQRVTLATDGPEVTNSTAIKNSVATIATNTTGVATAANQATEISSLSTIASNTAKVAGYSIPTFDYKAFTYSGTNISTIVFKSGGGNGTTVATLTFGYTSGNLTSITKT